MVSKTRCLRICVCSSAGLFSSCLDVCIDVSDTRRRRCCSFLFPLLFSYQQSQPNIRRSFPGRAAAEESEDSEEDEEVESPVRGHGKQLRPMGGGGGGKYLRPSNDDDDDDEEEEEDASSEEESEEEAPPAPIAANRGGGKQLRPSGGKYLRP